MGDGAGGGVHARHGGQRRPARPVHREGPPCLREGPGWVPSAAAPEGRHSMTCLTRRLARSTSSERRCPPAVRDARRAPGAWRGAPAGSRRSCRPPPPSGHSGVLSPACSVGSGLSRKCLQPPQRGRPTCRRSARSLRRPRRVCLAPSSRWWLLASGCVAGSLQPPLSHAASLLVWCL